jgi:probable phosphoglycerate mutase
MHQSLCEASFHVSDYLPEPHDPLRAAPDGLPSEIYSDFKLQVREGLAFLINQAESSGGAVLAISHGGVIKTALRLVLGGDAGSFRLYNTALTLIERRLGRWYLVHLNLWDHLEVAMRTR